MKNSSEPKTHLWWERRQGTKVSARALGRDKARGLKRRLACQRHTGAEAAAIALGGPVTERITGLNPQGSCPGRTMLLVAVVGSNHWQGQTSFRCSLPYICQGSSVVATTGGAAEAVSILTAARSIQHRENTLKKILHPTVHWGAREALGYSLV